MQNRCLKVVLACLVFMVPQGALAGNLLDLGMGAKALSMGRAQIAVHDLPSSFINPANASSINRFTFLSMNSLLMGEVPYYMFCAGFPLMNGAWGGLGFSFLNASVSDIFETGKDNAGNVIPISSFDYLRQQAIVSYGKDIADNIAVGISGKFISISMGSSNPYGAGFDMDAGILIYPQERISLGFVFENFLPSNYSNIKWSNGTKENFQNLIKGGLFYKFEESLGLAIDGTSARTLRIGIEKDFNKVLLLRGGVETQNAGTGNQASTLSCGVGIRLKDVNFDYAYHQDAETFSSSHFFSFGFSIPYKEVETPPLFMAKSEK